MMRRGHDALLTCALSPRVVQYIRRLFVPTNDLSLDIVEQPAVWLLEEISEREAVNAVSEFVDRYRIAKHKITKSKAGYFRGVCIKYWKQNRHDQVRLLIQQSQRTGTGGHVVIQRAIECLFTRGSGLCVSVIDECVQGRLAVLSHGEAVNALFEFCCAAMYRQEHIRNLNAYLMHILKRHETTMRAAREMQTDPRLARLGIYGPSTVVESRVLNARPPSQQQPSPMSTWRQLHCVPRGHPVPGASASLPPVPTVTAPGASYAPRPATARARGAWTTTTVSDLLRQAVHPLPHHDKAANPAPSVDDSSRMSSSGSALSLSALSALSLTPELPATPSPRNSMISLDLAAMEDLTLMSGLGPMPKLGPMADTPPLACCPPWAGAKANPTSKMQAEMKSLRKNLVEEQRRNQHLLTTLQNAGLEPPEMAPTLSS